ncbi:sulfatase family protein [Algibacter lectus]|uniref:Arylsulfatase A-like enzyme n=1 Tax=Algibacter lectus TaxID=221126 RepID=A0A4R8MEJ2_9FLAO|nr:sulfatase [Algibacter lectus]MWW25295.1 sulfatase-like hydrolase/transferase [Algibacter lectus]TDY64290.1 arylsulfatase A-like enzyme [Algibacter lectus]
MKYRLLIIVMFVCFNSVLKAQQPNIVWITSEDNSKHYMKLFDEHGIETPNIERLAKNGIVFNNAFSNAAVCSAARSTLITSSYGPRLATHYHRAEGKVTLPNNQTMFPAYLRKAGYYTANNAKEDYNINKPDDVWDDSSKKATWKNRKEGQPFFYVFNIGTTHEGTLHFSEETMNTTKTNTNPNSVFVQPNHPQTDLFKYTNAYYRDKIQAMDAEVGAVINKLKDDGLLENTIIFYYGDHGGVLPFSKGYLTETGLQVPLVVHVPEKYKNLSIFNAGSQTDAFVSFVDFGATVLNIAGIEIPKTMDGKPFLGDNIKEQTITKRNETFGYADRFDEKYDMVRSYRKGNLKYIRNFQPFNIDGLMNAYRYKQMAYAEWFNLFKAGQLNKTQSKFFETKAVEELYDIEKDPFETNNLADKEGYQAELKTMRKTLISWMECQPDLSFYPEFYLLENAIQNPVEFGNAHKKEIKSYLNISNLALLDYDKASSKISKHLTSNDPWKRYWALIVCTTFAEKAKAFIPQIENIMKSDTQLINRMRAAEYFGVTGLKDTTKDMIETVYQSKNDTEALLILNAIALQKDFYQQYNFSINTSKINKKLLENKLISERVAYINSK